MQITTKNQKQELRMRIFRLPHGSERSTYIYSFEPNPVLGCQGDNGDVIGSMSQYS